MSKQCDRLAQRLPECGLPQLLWCEVLQLILISPNALLLAQLRRRVRVSWSYIPRFLYYIVTQSYQEIVQERLQSQTTPIFDVLYNIGLNSVRDMLTILTTICAHITGTARVDPLPHRLFINSIV